MKRDFSKVPILAAVFAGALLAIFPGAIPAQGAPQITNSVDESQRVILKGNTPGLAVAKYDRGALESSAETKHVLLVLKRSSAQEADLKKLIDDQHNPSSSSFHQWLTPKEFGRRFGVEDSDVEVVKAWLETKGLTVNKVNSSKTLIDFSGTVGQVGSAFHTELHTYVREGITFHANNKDPEIPVALAPVVKGLASLNDISPKSFLVSKGRASFDPSTHLGTSLWNDPQCGSSPPAGSICTAYVPTPADMAVQYGLKSVYQDGITGRGITVGIISASNVDLSNVRNYRKFFKIGSEDNVPQMIVDGEDPGQNGAAEEAYLDVEVSGAMAPAAKINLYVSSDTLTTSGLLTALVRAVDDDVADVISLSYGQCEQDLGTAGNQFFYYNWQQAAAQGQSVFVSSGDSGSAGCDNAQNDSPAVFGLGVSGFASTPYNVAVGGTDFYYSQYSAGYGSAAANTQLAKYWGKKTSLGEAASLLAPIPEQPWDDTLGLNFLYPTYDSIAAGSGGPSMCALQVDDPATGYYTCTSGYPKPSWQVGPGVYADGVRDIPDVSLFAADGANLSFWPICIEAEDCTKYTTDSGSVYVTGVGGTSASSPAMAGIMALVDQSQKGRQGNPNAVFYALAAQYPSAFNDVTVGSNNVICILGTTDCSPDATDSFDSLQLWPAAKGYDMASGLGTVNGAKLIANWSKIKSTSTATTLGISSTGIPHGTPVTANVTVSSNKGTPTGSVALVTTSILPGQTGQGAIPLTDGSGSSTLYLPGGHYKVTANYSGDGTFGASESSPVDVSITPETSTTALTVDALIPNYEEGYVPTPVTDGASFAYGYILLLDATPAGASGQGYATGSITFTDKNSSLGVATLNTGTVAEIQTVRVPAGSHSIVASYSGDGSFKASKSAPINFTITKGATYTYPEDVSQWGPLYAGRSFSVPILIGGGNRGIAPSGAATVTLNSQTVTAPLTSVVAQGQPFATGTATFPDVQAGSYNLTVNYPGDSNYAASSSYPESVTVLPVALLPSTITLSSSTLNAGNNGTFTLSAKVIGSSKTPLTGGVYFFLNGLVQNFPATPLVDGVATVTLTNYNLFTGVNHATALYVGDANYRNSNSNSITITGNEGDFTMSFLNPNLAIGSGDSAKANLVLNSIQGLGGKVTLECVPSSGVDCSLSRSTVALDPLGSQSAVTVTVKVDRNRCAGGHVAVIAQDGGVVHKTDLSLTAQ